MSKEFQVQHCVDQLIKLLKAEGGTSRAEHLESLSNSKRQFSRMQVNTHKDSVEIIERALKPEEFKRKLEHLQDKNTNNLSSMVYLLNQIVKKPKLKKVLGKCADDKGNANKLISKILPPPDLGVKIPKQGTQLSPKAIEELRSDLDKATSLSFSNTDVFRKTLENRQQKLGNNFNIIPSHSNWLVPGSCKKRFLTDNFLQDPLTRHIDPPLGRLPTTMIECELVNDLLFVMIGIEGNYIVSRQDDSGSISFIIDSSIDVSFTEMAHLILPVAVSYHTVVSFVEERCLFEYGHVNHALCSAMKEILNDFRFLISQIEEKHKTYGLALQELYVAIRPASQQLGHLASLATTIVKANCVGGSVLSLIHNGIAASLGDDGKEKLYTYLANVANAPYLKMLAKWIYKGKIDDCYGEFLVEENCNFSKEKLQDEYDDNYWELRYTLCKNRIPNYLEPVADRILNTGKYLNVVHECGKIVECDYAREILYDPVKKEFINQINEAYSFASKFLLNLLINEHNLLIRIKSLKTYFLLNDGDFLLTFMDLTENEMKMEVNSIAQNRLDTLLELSLRTSMSEHDPYKDDLKIVLLPYDPITHLVRVLSIETVSETMVKDMDPNEINMTGLESVALDYEVKWPLSLVISRKVITNYQMIFRHLHYFKHVERYLNKVWLCFKHTKKTFLHQKSWSKKALTLLQRLMFFVRNQQDYMINEVLEPNWRKLQINIKIAKNIDEVLNFHTDFLRQSLQDCLLTNKDLLQKTAKLLYLCIEFSALMLGLYRQIENVRSEEKLEHKTLAGPPSKVDKKVEAERLKLTEKITDIELDQVANEAIQIKKTEKKFNELFKSMLNSIQLMSQDQGQHCLVNLVDKLDYNGFYRSLTKDDQQIVF